MLGEFDIVCIFCPTGKTFTFRNVSVIVDNESVLVFNYGAMSDGRMKTHVAIKANIVGYSTTPVETEG